MNPMLKKYQNFMKIYSKKEENRQIVVFRGKLLSTSVGMLCPELQHVILTSFFNFVLNCANFYEL